MNSVSEKEIGLIVQKVIGEISRQSLPFQNDSNSSNISTKKTVAVGSDHGGYEAKLHVIEYLNELENLSPAPSGAPGPVDAMISYTRDPDKLTLEIPMPFNQLEAEKRNLEYVVDTISNTGGVIVYYPLSVNIVEGI